MERSGMLRPTYRDLSDRTERYLKNQNTDLRRAPSLIMHIVSGWHFYTSRLKSIIAFLLIQNIIVEGVGLEFTNKQLSMHTIVNHSKTGGMRLDLHLAFIVQLCTSLSISTTFKLFKPFSTISKFSAWVLLFSISSNSFSCLFLNKINLVKRKAAIIDKVPRK